MMYPEHEWLNKNLIKTEYKCILKCCVYCLHVILLTFHSIVYLILHAQFYAQPILFMGFETATYRYYIIV